MATVEQSLGLQQVLTDSYAELTQTFGRFKTWVNQNDLVLNFICVSLNYYLNRSHSQLEN